MSRNYMSGSNKRKLKKAQEVQAKKMAGSMEKFISTTASTQLLSIETDMNEFQKEDNSAVKTNNGERILFCADDHEEKNASVSAAIDPQDDACRNNFLTSIDSSSCSNSGTQIVTIYDTDPAKWKIITDNMTEYFIKNPPPQNIDKVLETERLISGNKRFLTKSHFYLTKKNNEKIAREWLVLSCSDRSLYCWVCKLFGNKFTSLSTCGFNDWKHVAVRLAEHENSNLHRGSMIQMSTRLQSSSRIDSSVVMQYHNEVNYWRSVLKRVVACVKFLSVRGLAFFGENETIGSTSNGNFLGCLELLSEFDPFLAGHLQKYGNQGSGSTNYLSSTCLTEFIELMAQKVWNEITSSIATAKYFSLIVDTTPDVTHLDQLCFVLRYVGTDCEPRERFIKFVPIVGHSAENLTEIIVSTIEELGLNLLNCRGQSYDNAANMAGRYSGVQARIKNLNPLAEFVPCSGHSLNLVGVNAVESSTTAVGYFCILQGVYNFFSSSTSRWQALNANLSSNFNKLTLKSCSDTRWCADAESTKALRRNYPEVMKTLEEISNSKDATPSTKNEAKSLHKKLNKFETVINTVVWDSILQRLNKTSKCLQYSAGNIGQISPLYDSLINYIQHVRDNFGEFEKEAQNILPEIASYTASRNKKVPKSRLLDDSDSEPVELKPREKFIVNCHYVLCDALLSNLKTRKEPYDGLLKKFSCLSSYNNFSVHTEAKNLQEYYASDLGDEFADELLQFVSILDKNETANEMLKRIKTYNLSSVFSNVETALRIFLTIPISNCSGERSFSQLKRLKSPLRSYILQNKLSQLALLSLNSDITSQLDYDDIIDSFANCKLRKKPLKK